MFYMVNRTILSSVPRKSRVPSGRPQAVFLQKKSRKTAEAEFFEIILKMRVVNRAIRRFMIATAEHQNDAPLSGKTAGAEFSESPYSLFEQHRDKVAESSVPNREVVRTAFVNFRVKLCDFAPL